MGAYVAKLLVFAALIFALKNSALDLRVASVVIFSLVVSLAVYKYGISEKIGAVRGRPALIETFCEHEVGISLQ